MKTQNNLDKSIKIISASFLTIIYFILLEIKCYDNYSRALRSLCHNNALCGIYLNDGKRKDLLVPRENNPENSNPSLQIKHFKSVLVVMCSGRL